MLSGVLVSVFLLFGCAGEGPSTPSTLLGTGSLRMPFGIDELENWG